MFISKMYNTINNNKKLYLSFKYLFDEVCGILLAVWAFFYNPVEELSTSDAAKTVFNQQLFDEIR